jgi:hypothetical protein
VDAFNLKEAPVVYYLKEQRFKIRDLMVKAIERMIEGTEDDFD